MRRVGGVIAAIVLAARSFFGVEGARAGPADEHRFLLFSGFNLWRHGGFGHGGMLWSPNGLTQEGFTLKLLLAGGQYRYHAGTTEVTGTQALASVMGGWRFKRDGLEITLFLGPDLQMNRLSPDDRGNRMRGTQFGTRVGADFWYQPNQAVMVNGGVSASTIGPNYWARGAVGWRFMESVWIGPELMALGGDRYHQFRAGVHATGWRTQTLEWSAGFGYAHDTDDRDGLYTRIGVIIRR
jgi:hypothetical protein